MRASELLSVRSEKERATLARLLGASSDDTEPLLSAMRASDLHERLLRRCDNELMREDLSLLCANPFDTVLADELVDPAMFSQIALIQAAEGEDGFRVNLDMALSMVPSVRLEFGFAATLLARLPEDALGQLARAIEVGPRTCRVDYLLALAERLLDPALVKRRLARLREDDRTILYDAIELGELPDQIDGLRPGAPTPVVRLAPGAAGALGLAFIVEEPARRAPARPVVPLEVQQEMLDWLAQIPAAPAESSRVSARRRRQSPSSAGSVERSPPNPPVRNTPRGLHVPGLVGARLREEFEPAAPRSAEPSPAPQKIARMASGFGISAWVDLEDSQSIALIRTDAQLDASVVDYVSERFALLREGVDVEAWVSRCAQRLQWETETSGG